MEKELVVYLITTLEGNRTYVGITNNLKRRLRQHNGELVGGAKYTRGKEWRLVLVIKGLTSSQTRKLEWRLHHPHNRHNSEKDILTRRIMQLIDVMNMPRWTKSCEETRGMLALICWCHEHEKSKFTASTKFNWPSGKNNITHEIL